MGINNEMKPIKNKFEKYMHSSDDLKGTYIHILMSMARIWKLFLIISKLH